MSLLRNFASHPKETLLIFSLVATVSGGMKIMTLSKQLEDADNTIRAIGAKAIMSGEDPKSQLYSIRTETEKYIIKRYKETGKPYWHYTGNVADVNQGQAK